MDPDVNFHLETGVSFHYFHLSKDCQKSGDRNHGPRYERALDRWGQQLQPQPRSLDQDETSPLVNGTSRQIQQVFLATRGIMTHQIDFLIFGCVSKPMNLSMLVW